MATLVFFVGHMAGRINVDTVIELVSEDVRQAIDRLMLTAPQPALLQQAVWRGATPVIDPRRGCLQQLDDTGLAAWAAAHGTALRLLVRPGDDEYLGAAIAVMTPAVDGAAAAIRAATAVGGERVSAGDLEYSIRQLVEVGVRALSPGINDPHTAMSVLDRLAELQRRADLVEGDAERDVTTPADLADVRRRHRRFAAVRSYGALGALRDDEMD